MKREVQCMIVKLNIGIDNHKDTLTRNNITEEKGYGFQPETLKNNSIRNV